MANACLFCGDDSAGLTDEHVLPDWMTTDLPHKPHSHTLSRQFTVGGELRRDRMDLPLQIGQQVVKVVCKNCNTGWMSQMESDMKPILLALATGRNERLDNVKRRSLATWLSKTSMIREQINPRATFFSAGQRTWLMERMAPPRWTVCWIALGEYFDTPTTSHTVIGVSRAPIKVPNLAVSTFTFGQLVAQVLTTTDKWLHDLILNHFPVNILASFGFHAPAVWPLINTDILWPPEGKLIPQDAREMIRQLPFIWLDYVTDLGMTDTIFD